MSRSKVGAALTRERRTTHGPFDAVAKSTWDLMRTVSQMPNWTRMNDTQRMALQENFHKVARIGHGDHMVEDHWNDIAGYGELGASACRAAQEEKGAARASRKRAKKIAPKSRPTKKKKVVARKKPSRPAPRRPARAERPAEAAPAPAERPRRQRTRNRRVVEQSPVPAAAE